jgi:myosin heavy subunit
MSNQSGVYVKDKTYGWLPAQISTRNESSATVLVSIPQHEYASSTQVTKEERTVQFNEYEDETLPLQNVLGSGSLMVVADMCDLPSLHEAAILYNLKERHEQKEPYTRVGDIVIAMNPFQVSLDLSYAYDMHMHIIHVVQQYSTRIRNVHMFLTYIILFQKSLK